MFSDPESNLNRFDVQAGMHVVDLGAGSGFYTLALSRRVGPSGKVYAIDVQKDLLEKLKKEALKNHMMNIEVVWGNIEKIGGTKLKEGFVDRVVASNVLFQIENEHRKNFVVEIKRILKQGGKVLVIDWSDSFSGMGPSQKLIVLPATAEALFTKEGFKVESDVSAGDHHWGIIFIKQ